ncbi:hypothetical protein HKG03_001880 [Salmonella enterica subsp. enterica serovar Schwarzengrund]|uniref:Outer membrane protein assembly factor BamE n=5 Tax=Salmonella enterica TaxID=28901 RepID=A0A3V9PQJ6_SALET|nr:MULTISPECIES: hypothetical protein [Salmonella]EAA0586471.1 hypothetical protein [Salmonella enterica subsp. enterica serovar Newport]EAA6468221.1 hypothetical protein [Salmonella enterica subsp. enterica serovar Chester]EAZ9648231.1 hypothetical protein [Salmonella enterica subsp. enterica serovar Typhimurium]EBV6694283.1 hypothetical protein [Salmonella enterica subsp. enterica serovar Oslo]EBV7396419.1 hypothetical protein [Salmonella enterica subsp. enterica serovar Blockley]EBW5627326
MNRFIIFLFLTITFLLSGCSSTGNQSLRNETSQSLQSKIVKNKTTKSEITSALGEPDTRTTLDSGNESWRYFMVNNQINASSFIPIVGLFTGGSQSQARTLDIDFKGDIVSQWSFSENNSTTQSGPVH